MIRKFWSLVLIVTLLAALLPSNSLAAPPVVPPQGREAAGQRSVSVGYHIFTPINREA